MLSGCGMELGRELVWGLGTTGDFAKGILVSES